MLLEWFAFSAVFLSCRSDGRHPGPSAPPFPGARMSRGMVENPPGYRTKGGESVLLMCPPGSHGNLRKWSYGVTRTRPVLILGPDRIYPYVSCWSFLFDPACGSRPL